MSATPPAATATTPPDAQLLITSACPHCPSVLQSLSALLKSGRIGRLDVINIGVHPEVAQALGARAVPWLRLGPFVLTGQQTPAALAQWVERAQAPEAINDYLRERLNDGDISGVLAALQHTPPIAHGLVQLLGDPEAELQVRLGAAAVIEHLEGSATLHGLIDALTALTAHDDARIRMDAAYALGLTHAETVRGTLQTLLQDSDAGVREATDDSLGVL